MHSEEIEQSSSRSRFRRFNFTRWSITVQCSTAQYCISLFFARSTSGLRNLFGGVCQFLTVRISSTWQTDPTGFNHEECRRSFFLSVWTNDTLTSCPKEIPPRQNPRWRRCPIQLWGIDRHSHETERTLCLCSAEDVCAVKEKTIIIWQCEVRNDFINQWETPALSHAIMPATAIAFGWFGF